MEKLFVKCTRDGRDSYVSYFGQDEDTVRRLLKELGCTDVQMVKETECMAVMSKKLGEK